MLALNCLGEDSPEVIAGNISDPNGYSVRYLLSNRADDGVGKFT